VGCSTEDEEDRGELLWDEVISDWRLQLVAFNSSLVSGAMEQGVESRGGHSGEERSRDDARW
jgi:hypothetical protein